MKQIVELCVNFVQILNSNWKLNYSEQVRANDDAANQCLWVEEKCPQRKFSEVEQDARRNFVIGFVFVANLDAKSNFRVKHGGKSWFLVVEIFFRV